MMIIKGSLASTFCDIVYFVAKLSKNLRNFNSTCGCKFFFCIYSCQFCNNDCGSFILLHVIRVFNDFLIELFE